MNEEEREEEATQRTEVKQQEGTVLGKAVVTCSKQRSLFRPAVRLRGGQGSGVGVSVS